ncbi:hypothetical protein O9993_03000 [Vibrio lentus]|nr:hypothetical protein [Vibrio lentus]
MATMVRDAFATVLQPTLPFQNGWAGDKVIFRPAILMFRMICAYARQVLQHMDQSGVTDISFDLAARLNGRWTIVAFGLFASLPTGKESDLTADQHRLSGQRVYGREGRE